MLRQTLKSCSNSKSDFFLCVLFELVISHIKKWFSNSFAFSSCYHSVTLPLCFLFHCYVHPDLPVFSVSHHFYNFSVQTVSHSINSIRLIYGLLYAVLQLWDFFLPSDPSTCVKILFHCFHSLNSELGLWLQLDDRVPNSEKINCCC